MSFTKHMCRVVSYCYDTTHLDSLLKPDLLVLSFLNVTYRFTFLSLLFADLLSFTIILINLSLMVCHFDFFLKGNKFSWSAENDWMWCDSQTTQKCSVLQIVVAARATKLLSQLNLSCLIMNKSELCSKAQN